MLCIQFAFIHSHHDDTHNTQNKITRKNLITWKRKEITFSQSNPHFHEYQIRCKNLLNFVFIRCVYFYTPLPLQFRECQQQFQQKIFAFFEDHRKLSFCMTKHSKTVHRSYIYTKTFDSSMWIQFTVFRLCDSLPINRNGNERYELLENIDFRTVMVYRKSEEELHAIQYV